VWNLYWLLVYDGLLCEPWDRCGIFLIPGAGFRVEAEIDAKDIRE
jgi:hypothetical protein